MGARVIYLQGGEGSPATSVAHSFVDDLDPMVIIGGHTTFDLVVARPAREVMRLVLPDVPIIESVRMGRERYRPIACSQMEFLARAMAADALFLCKAEHAAAIPIATIVDAVITSDRPRRVGLIGWDPPERLFWHVPPNCREWFKSFSLDVSDLRPVLQAIRNFLTR